MKIKLILFHLILSNSMCNAQTFQWATSTGAASPPVLSISSGAISVDGSGNVFHTGSFTGTIDFDPGLGIFNLTSIGTRDIFVTKLSASGNFIWAKNMGGQGSAGTNDITLDAFGNVYITGSFDTIIDFDPGSGVFNLTSNGSKDCFISKLTASGNFVWAKSLGGGSSDGGKSLCIDATGNVYITGGFDLTVDFDPGPGIFSIVSTGNYDAFILKLSSAGSFVWAKSLGGGNSQDVPMAIALDITGNVFTTGRFDATGDFDPGPGSFYMSPLGFSPNIYISKLTSSGNFIWAKSMGGGSGDLPYSIAIDVAGSVYTTGRFSGQADFDPGPGTFYLGPTTCNTSFISKLDASGNFSWAKALVGCTTGTALSIDGSNNVYSTGYFFGTADLDPGPGIFNISCSNVADIFFSKLDAQGNFIWGAKMGGAGNDQAADLCIDASANVYTVGFFEQTVDFDLGSGIFNLTSINYNVFVHKMSEPLSVNGLSAPTILTVFPNPANGIFSIESGIEISEIEIRNVLGELVYSSTPNNTHVQINLGQETSGVYFILTTTETGSCTNKIILSK